MDYDYGYGDYDYSDYDYGSASDYGDYSNYDYSDYSTPYTDAPTEDFYSTSYDTGYEGISEIDNSAAPGEAGYGWRYFSDGTVISPDNEYYANNPETGEHELIWSPDKDDGSGFGMPILLNPDINVDLGNVYDFGYGDDGSATSGVPNWMGSDTVEIANPTTPGEAGYGWRYFSDGTAIGPDGKYYSNNPTTGKHEVIYDPRSQSGGIIDSLLKNAKGAFTKTNPDGTSSVDWNAITKAGVGLAGAYAGTQAKDNLQRVGYQGSIPSYQAVRRPVSETYDPNRRAGSSGQRYATDVVFSGPGGPTFDQALSLTAAQAADLQQFNQQNPAKEQAMAQGGMAQGLGKYLQGETDGMADQIPSSIDGEQPAALSHGEFVIPADVVSHLGNGNSDAGAKKLYQMMDKIRVARTGTKKQGREIDPDEFTMGGLASAYATGGSVQRYDAGGTVKPTYESNLSNWAGPYVTNMLGKGEALSELPYMGYSGPLTAGASNLQTQAFQKAGDLKTPSSISQAANTAGNIAGNMQNLSFNPTKFNVDTFGTQQAQQYMNPYLQGSLDPQLAEARRQAEISRVENAGRLTRAGAYGGSRQAIMEAEGNRNLGTNLANITGQGYNTAYQNAMAQFNADQNRNIVAQQADEQSRQFGSNFGLQGLQAALNASQTQGALGAQENQVNLANLQQMSSLGNTQRDIESQGIAADYAQFQEERDYPYKMLQFQQSLLGSLPLATQGSTIPGTNTLQDAAGGAAALIDELKRLGVIK
jgi:hypothetical protein